MNTEVNIVSEVKQSTEVKQEQVPEVNQTKEVNQSTEVNQEQSDALNLTRLLNVFMIYYKREHKGGSFFEGIVDDADTSKAMEYFYEHLSEYNISYNKACINYDETRLDELDEKYILEVNNVRVKMSDNVISLIIGLLNDYDEEKDNWRILDV